MSTCDANPVAETCRPHTCDDPLACALVSLIDGDDPREEEITRLNDLIDQVCTELQEARPSKLRDALMRILLP